MNKLMLIGSTGSGKTTLCQVLHDMNIQYKKTQAVEYFDYTIDTPGEYIENRAYYRALIVASTECDVVGLVQDSTLEASFFPPGFASIFAKPVIGVVTKKDRSSEEEIKRAEEFLEDAGAQIIFKISSVNGDGIGRLKDYLTSL